MHRFYFHNDLHLFSCSRDSSAIHLTLGNICVLKADDRGRLTSAFTQTYTYDEASRITGKVGQTYKYTSTETLHAPGLVNGVIYNYDNNGNLTEAGSRTYVWNGENRLAAVLDNGVETESYLYDADGARVMRSDGGTVTYTFFPGYEEENGVVVRHYTFAGMAVALRRGGEDFYFLHGDHPSASSGQVWAASSCRPMSTAMARRG